MPFLLCAHVSKGHRLGPAKLNCVWPVCWHIRSLNSGVTKHRFGRWSPKNIWNLLCCLIDIRVLLLILGVSRMFRLIVVGCLFCGDRPIGTFGELATYSALRHFGAHSTEHLPISKKTVAVKPVSGTDVQTTA